MKIDISVPAKINLWLEVLRKREDGYHELSSLMLPISVFDKIGITVGQCSGPITLDCDVPHIPVDRTNLAWRAASLFKQAGGLENAMHIDLQKSIPSGAGLGGGSADAAGVLLALNARFDAVLTDEILDDLATKLGADVPFFLRQRAALATGIGEKLEPVGGVPEYRLLLIKPEVSVPTKWVYENLKLTRGHAHITLNRFNTDPWQFEGFIANDLESVTVSRYPIVSDLKNWLIGNGALAASMSGSGPTVFGIFKSSEDAGLAETAARSVWKDFWIQTASVIGSPEISVRRSNVF